MLHLRESTSCCFCCSAASRRSFFSCSSLCRVAGEISNAACHCVPDKAALHTPVGEQAAGQALLPRAYRWQQEAHQSSLVLILLVLDPSAESPLQPKVQMWFPQEPQAQSWCEVSV